MAWKRRQSPASSSDPVEAVVAAAAPTTAVVHGTRFPLDPRGLWTVDLWSPPTDLAQLDLLARATICHRSPGCEVRLTLARPVRGGLRSVAQGANP